MVSQKNYSHLQGFDDYHIVSIVDYCLTNTWGFNLPYCFDKSPGAYIFNKDIPVRIHVQEHPMYSWIDTVVFEPELATNHSELLNSAKKVYTHQSCKLSRSMMAEKYKKSLNPFLSDAIIIPKPNYDDFALDNVALFINEQARIIVKVNITDDKSAKIIQGAKDGDKFGDWVACQPKDSYGNSKPYTVNDIMSAEFFYYGELLYIPNSQSWAMEVLTHTLPADKIVFEDSVQESLSSETNQLDFDSLCSIKDMLDSSDENTQSAGLKSLSMMDWMHYPNSIKFMMDQTNMFNWRYNKACNSTSVKYMLKTICGTANRRRWPGDYDTKIYEKDFELFKQLKCHYHHIQPDQIISSIRSLNFMNVNSEGFISPNIKSRAA